MGWLLLAMMGFSLVATISELSTGYDLSAIPFIHTGFLVAVIAPALWTMLSPQRLVWGRDPIAPRLTSSELLDKEARVQNWPAAIWFTAMSASLVVLGIVVGTSNPWIGIPIALLFGLGLIRSALLIVRKLKHSTSGAKE